MGSTFDSDAPTAFRNGQQPSRRRWIIMAVFALNCGSNCFMWMDFVAIPESTKQIFGYCADNDGQDRTGLLSDPGSGSANNGEMASDKEERHHRNECVLVGDTGTTFVGTTYSASLYAVVPAAILVMIYLDSHNFLVSTGGMACNCGGAWMRWCAVTVATSGSPELGRWCAILSSVLLGFAAAVIICSYSSISARWFPPHERTFATSVAVQSNYLGWCIGAVAFPYMQDRDLSVLLLYQAAMCSVFFLLFVAVYRDNRHSSEKPGVTPENLTKALLQSPGLSGEQEAAGSNFLEQVRALCANKQYMLQCMCYSALAGVSFAVPAFQTSAFALMRLTEQDAAWTNFAFILSGGACATQQ